MKHLFTSLKWASLRTFRAIAVLAFAAWLTYGPAMNRVFVADQLWYFAELNGQTSLMSGLQHYDYAASRRYEKGDDALFRPLLFVWLAVANSLFSYNHIAWNIASLALHLLTAVCLFRLLMVIDPSPLALGASLLFIVMKPQMELVLWNHLGGYLLANAFFLVALRAWVIRLRTPKHLAPLPAVDATYAFFILCAALCYESMVPAMVILGAIMFLMEQRRGKKPTTRGIVALLLPLFIYGGLYAMHLVRVERWGYVDRPDGGNLLGPDNAMGAVLKGGRALLQWAEETALPSALKFSISPYDRMSNTLAVSFAPWLSSLNLLLAASVVWLVWRSFSRSHWERVSPIVTALLCILAAYAGLISLGRGNEVFGITYYLYPFCLLSVVIIYACLDLKKLRFWSSAAAVAITAMLIMVHATGTREVAIECGRVNLAASTYLRSIGRFVEAHESEPDFSFRVSPSSPAVDPGITMIEGYPDAPKREFTLPVSRILFSRYYREDAPKYVISPGPG